MSDKSLVIAILGFQITVVFGVLALISQMGTVIWGEVAYMGIGILVTISAVIRSNSGDSS